MDADAGIKLIPKQGMSFLPRLLAGNMASVEKRMLQYPKHEYTEGTHMWHHTLAYADHYHHPYYAGHAVADHGDWLVHTIVGGIIHGLIYGAIFRLFRGMSLQEALIVAVIGIALVSGGYWFWNHRLDG